jgi:hypothetical protein
MNKLNSGDACYIFGLDLSSSTLQAAQFIIKIYRNVILLLVLNRCKLLSFTLREEHKLRLYENKVQKRTSCLHRAPLVSKTLFIVPTDAHYYKIIEMLKQFKITILAPTCFGSRRNHHQGAVLCLAKTTKWFFCARRYRRSQC